MFEIISEDGDARIGGLITKKGKVETPFFMPVSTKMAVKHIDSMKLNEMKIPAVISNAFILSMRPGTKMVGRMGGVGKMMNFDGINFTDSGGFQMYSPTIYYKANDSGIYFRNPYSGQKIFMTPEDNMKIQLELGSDVAMCLDSMPMYEESYDDIKEAVRKTVKWAGRCKKTHDSLKNDFSSLNLKPTRQMDSGIQLNSSLNSQSLTLPPSLRNERVKSLAHPPLDRQSPSDSPTNPRSGNEIDGTNIGNSNEDKVGQSSEKESLGLENNNIVNRQLLFGITQGGKYEDLRRECIIQLLKLDFDGYAIGGFGLGESRDEEFKIIRLHKKLIPADRPIYLMGIGDPIEILEAIGMGCDIFDSRLPTQNARRGSLFTSKGRLRILRKEFEFDEGGIDEKCRCFVCENYNRAYVRYLLREGEAVGKELASYHNIYFLNDLINKAKDAIRKKEFEKFMREFKERYVG
jgi:queuine/archaeosine tRNA-ribosyltransferase